MVPPKCRGPYSAVGAVQCSAGAGAVQCSAVGGCSAVQCSVLQYSAGAVQSVQCSAGAGAVQVQVQSVGAAQCSAGAVQCRANSCATSVLAAMRSAPV
jgi:hypothetical protein